MLNLKLSIFKVSLTIKKFFGRFLRKILVKDTFLICLDCRVTKEKQNFFVLSDKQTDANTANTTCSTLGGKLAEVTSQTASEDIKTFLKENLISNGKEALYFYLFYVSL